MQFTVEASTSDPRTREGYARDNLADFDCCPDRSSANAKTRHFHRRGLWVEVYHTDTGELMAGPIDPDQPCPSYIV